MATLSWSRRGVLNHVEEALSDLRLVIEADAAEVFLAEPGGEDLVMTACSSGDLDAFLEKARFPKGIVTAQIPDPGLHLTRFYGAYANRVRSSLLPRRLAP